MENLNQLTTAVLTKLFNKTEQEIADLIFDGDNIKENAFNDLIALDAARVKRYKDEQQKFFDNGYSKGKKETAETWEKQVKELHGIDADSTGEELIAAVREHLEKSKGSKSKLTDDDIKKHPLFLEVEKNTRKQWEEKLSAKQKEFEDYKTGIERSTRVNKAKDKVNEIFAALNPILPKDPARAENQKRIFLSQFDGFDYELTDDGIVILNEGKRMEDAQGYPVKFDDFVKEKVTSLYDLQAQNPKGSSQNSNDNRQQQPQQGKNGINMNPRNEAEYADAMQKLDAARDFEGIVKLTENFKASQK